MFKSFQLPKTGGTATIAILGPDDMADVLALQETTRSALPDDQKMFVLPQPVSYFQNLLEQKNGVMVGIHAGETLVSQMVMMGQLTLEETIDQQKLTRNEVAFHHADPADSVVIAKSMAVHPDWRGNELSQHMLEAACAIPLARTAAHIFAQISSDNVRSWELFLKNGFGITAAAIDPNDKKARFIVQKPAAGLNLHPGQSGEADPVRDFSSIMRLTQRDALIGLLTQQNRPFTLAFHASAAEAQPRKAAR